jgi:hypothetical protein
MMNIAESRTRPARSRRLLVAVFGMDGLRRIGLASARNF